jgi:RsiW-degrading membrane proteinase PrsW (M82 family)
MESMNWDLFDFAAASIIIGLLVFAIRFILRNAKQPKTRWVLIATVVVLVALLWAELAVGIFGSPLAGS